MAALRERLVNKRILMIVSGGVLFSIALMPIDIRVGIAALICDVILLPLILVFVRPIVESRVRSEMEAIREGSEKAERSPDPRRGAGRGPEGERREHDADAPR